MQLEMINAGDIHTHFSLFGNAGPGYGYVSSFERQV